MQYNKHSERRHDTITNPVCRCKLLALPHQPVGHVHCPVGCQVSIEGYLDFKWQQEAAPQMGVNEGRAQAKGGLRCGAGEDDKGQRVHGRVHRNTRPAWTSQHSNDNIL